MQELDRLTDKYNLTKIKTIGDSYMAACGVPVPCGDHCERGVYFCFEAHLALRGIRNPLGGEVHMRTGMHVGSLVSGVVGTRRFAYDLWGDTVNVASRMESNGVSGMLCVSRRVVNALPADKFNVEERPPIHVKGQVSSWQVYLAMAESLS